MTGGFLTPKFPSRLSAVVAAVLVTAAALSHAGSISPTAVGSAPAANAGGPRWAELSPAQRSVLAPLAGEWDGIDPRGKERWLGVASRFPKMPADEQQRANQRMVEWSRMTPAQRTQARLNFQEVRDVSREEREARWKAYQALPEDAKRALAAKRAAAAATAAASAASVGASSARRHQVTPVYALQPKSNVVASVPAPRTPLEPGSTVLRTNPGATTTLLTRRVSPPAHQKEGQPKIAAGPGYVDRTTLLPKRGPQAAVAAAPTAASQSTR